MTRRLRLDAELVRRGLARSRDQAADLIAQGRVTVGGGVARKGSTAVGTDAAVVVLADSDDEPDYVSRGAHKLAGALTAFGGPGRRNKSGMAARSVWRSQTSRRAWEVHWAALMTSTRIPFSLWRYSTAST